MHILTYDTFRGIPQVSLSLDIKITGHSCSLKITKWYFSIQGGVNKVQQDVPELNGRSVAEKATGRF